MDGKFSKSKIAIANSKFDNFEESGNYKRT